MLAAVVAFAAWRARALTRDGAITAFAVGTLVFAGGRLGFTLVLLAFFVPSVLLSRLGRAKKRALTDVGKPGARDAMQVLANGGVAALCALLYAVTSDFRWAWAFAGAFAAATADTWATEIGTWAAQPPISIVTRKPVAAGLSGGVTLAGTCAEIAGAIWIGTVMVSLTAAATAASVAQVAQRLGHGAARTSAASAIAVGLPPPLGIAALGSAGVVIAVLAIPIAGVLGATVDSVLGATLQELRRCERCGRTCETDPHACGGATRVVRGMPGLTNDAVNLAATAAGALVAFALA